jgi:hypothetical protein
MDPLQHLQIDIASRLMAAPFFNSFAVFWLRPRKARSAMQIQDSINLSLVGIAGGNGVAIEVMMPLLDRTDEASGILMFEPRAVVRVRENPAINMSDSGTQIPAEEIALNVALELEGFLPYGYGSALYVPRDGVVPREDPRGFVVYDVNFMSRFGLENPVKAAMPQISGDHTGVTIICASAGAVIYYTTDESYPWGGSEANPSTAILYSAPFACAAGVIVRACAFLSGAQQSDAASFLVQ